MPSTSSPAPWALSRFCNSVTQPLVWPFWITPGQDEEVSLTAAGAAEAGPAPSSVPAERSAVVAANTPVLTRQPGLVLVAPRCRMDVLPSCARNGLVFMTAKRLLSWICGLLSEIVRAETAHCRDVSFVEGVARPADAHLGPAAGKGRRNWHFWPGRHACGPMSLRGNGVEVLESHDRAVIPRTTVTVQTAAHNVRSRNWLDLTDPGGRKKYMRDGL